MFDRADARPLRLVDAPRVHLGTLGAWRDFSPDQKGRKNTLDDVDCCWCGQARPLPQTTSHSFSQNVLCTLGSTISPATRKRNEGQRGFS